MKKYIFMLLIVFLFFVCPNKANAIVSPTKYFYINDYANILSVETEEYIFQKSVALNNADGTQIVIVTVPNLEGSSLEEYSNQLFRNFGIGDIKKNNGLLLLLALEERQFRVEVGDGLGGILPDGKTGRFQDQYIIPYLKENNWDEGIKNGYDAFYAEIVKENNLNIDYNQPIELEQENNLVFEIGFYVAIMIGSFVGITIKTSKKKKKNGTKIYLIVWSLVFVASIVLYPILIFLLIINIISFFVARYARFTGVSGGYYRGGRGGSSRGGGFSGGGGFSSGGGSSRGF